MADCRRSALHAHAEAGRLEELRSATRAAFDIDSFADEGTTALHLACTAGHVDCVVALLEARADVNAVDAARWTPLHVAITEGHEAAVAALLDGGADTSIRAVLEEHERCDAVHMAEVQGEPEIAELIRQANLRHAARATATRSGLRAVIGAVFRSPLLVPIWAVEALNYLVHACWRPVPWHPLSVSAGYALWGLQLACFFRCQLTPSPPVSKEWTHDAENGLVASRRCPQTGSLVPPRARYVHRAGGTVCMGPPGMGTPRNGKPPEWDPPILPTFT